MSIAAELSRIAELLERWAEPAAVIGGIAIIAQVRARPTRDVDIVLSVPEGREQALLDLSHECGFEYDAEETRAFLEGGLVRLWGPPDRVRGFGADILFVDSAFMETVVKRAEPMDLGGVQLPIATPEDLILLKLEANRPIDIEDVLELKTVFGTRLDQDYLRRWAEDLDLRDRLELYFGDSPEMNPIE